MDAISLVEAVSAGATSAVVTGGAFRRYWTRRETRQQAAFRRAVQAVVDASVTDLITRQQAFERRQGQHLDRQDRAIAALRDELGRRGYGGGRA